MTCLRIFTIHRYRIFFFFFFFCTKVAERKRIMLLFFSANFNFSIPSQVSPKMFCLRILISLFRSQVSSKMIMKTSAALLYLICGTRYSQKSHFFFDRKFAERKLRMFWQRILIFLFYHKEAWKKINKIVYRTVLVHK